MRIKDPQRPTVGHTAGQQGQAAPYGPCPCAAAPARRDVMMAPPRGLITSQVAPDHTRSAPDGRSRSAQIQVYLLGGFRVLVNGRPVSDEGWHRKKARQLLKVLLTRSPHSSTKDELIELLWPESDPDTGLTNLRSTVHALRRALDAPEAQLGADTVIADRESVRLRQGASMWVDADEFEKTLEHARTAEDSARLLQRADELYVGHYLPEDAYEDWAAERREQLKQAWANLRFQLAQHWESRGDLESAAASLRQLLQADPCDERAARELMRLLSKQGRRSEAVRVYQSLVRKLRDDLDVEPSNVTTFLFETELAKASQERGQTPARTRAQHKLPAQPGVLIGRDHELAMATAMLLREDVRLLTLVGPGGCGKTRLALHLGNDLLQHFAHGVWFVDLATVRNPEQVVFAIGRALGVDQPADGQSYVARLSETIGESQMMLILDNFEQVVDEAPRVSELLAGCPNLKVVATSREPLHLRWEQELEVPPLAAPPSTRPVSFEEIAAAPAVALFAQRAQAIKPEWRLTRANAAAVAQLCRRLDCLPLAIELAAARIKLFTPAAMLERLEQNFDLLSGAVRDVPERHRGLGLAIGWSYDLLSPEERAIFRRLAVFSGGCSLDAAVAVCTDSAKLGIRWLRTLQALVDKSLVRGELQGDNEPRFVMLETIRDFAHTELLKAEDPTTHQRRHAIWCAQLAEQAEPELSGPLQSLWLDQLEREHDNFKAALRWCFNGGDPEPGIRLAAALGPFWEMRGFVQEGHHWLEQAIGLRESVSASLRVKVGCAAGHIAFLRGEDRTARTLLEESLRASRTLGSPHLVLRALVSLGLVAISESDHARGAALLDEARQIAIEVAEHRNLAASLHLLGQIAFDAAHFAEARSLFEESEELRRREGNNWAVAQVLCDLGLVHLAQGDAAAARALLCEALIIWRDLEDVWGIAYALENFAMLSSAPQPESAVKLLATACMARQRVGIRRMPAREAKLRATQQSCATVLGDSAFDEAWSAGGQASLSAVVDELLTSIAE
jgi:predicted ATPase/DNA-binding SARP family transcriptional activator